jgi:hypothetical protein
MRRRVERIFQREAGTMDKLFVGAVMVGVLAFFLFYISGL